MTAKNYTTAWHCAPHVPMLMCTPVSTQTWIITQGSIRRKGSLPINAGRRVREQDAIVS